MPNNYTKCNHTCLQQNLNYFLTQNQASSKFQTSIIKGGHQQVKKKNVVR